jgi:exodeoxyribonuclease X
MPEGLDREIGLPVHRAMPDAYVTAHHLRDQLNQAGLEQLLRWSDEPGLLPRVPMGPDRGRYWSELDDETLRRFSATVELEKRNAASPSSRPASAQGQLF